MTSPCKISSVRLTCTESLPCEALPLSREGPSWLDSSPSLPTWLSAPKPMSQAWPSAPTAALTPGSAVTQTIRQLLLGNGVHQSTGSLQRTTLSRTELCPCNVSLSAPNAANQTQPVQRLLSHVMTLPDVNRLGSLLCGSSTCIPYDFCDNLTGRDGNHSGACQAWGLHVRVRWRRHRGF